MESSELEIKKYLQLIHNKKNIFIIAAAVIITVATLVSYLLPKVYEAKCIVFIEKNVISNLIKGIAVTPSMEERLKVLSDAINSRNLILKVIDELGLKTDREQTEIEELVIDFQKRTNIRIKGTELFTVFYRDNNPRFSKDYVNTLVSKYLEENISAKREEAYGANRFLTEQIQFFKDKLDKADAEVTNFRKEKGIFIAIDDHKLVEEIKNSQEVLDELKIKKMELEAKKGLIEKQIDVEKPYTVAIFGRAASRTTGDPLNDRLFILEKKLNELLVQYTENYPDVIMVKAEIESLKGQLKNRETSANGDQNTETEMSTLNPLYQKLKEDLTKTELELVALKAKEGHMVKLIESKKEYLRNIPVEKKKLTDIERERDANKNIYEELTRRLGQSEVSKQMEVQDKATTFKIVDPAVLPGKPISPNRIMIISLGIIAGLAGGLGLLMLLDYMDKSVKKVELLKQLGLPILATIPSIQNSNEIIKKRVKGIISYSLAGFYMMCVLSILAMELLEMTYIDDFFNNIHLQQHIVSLKDSVRGFF